MGWSGGVQNGIVFLHLGPDVVGDGDAVAIEIHGEGGDDVRFGAEADGRGDGLTGEHVGSVEFAGNDVVEEGLPVGLGDNFDLEAFVFEEALFLGDDDGSAIGKFDKAEF